MVFAPSAISWLVLGRRPAAGSGTNGVPPGSGSAIASKAVRPARNGAPVQQVVHAATRRSCSIVATIGRTSFAAALLAMASQVTPYKAGEASRWLRLAANTMAAVSPATPTVALAIALRT